MSFTSFTMEAENAMLKQQLAMYYSLNCGLNQQVSFLQAETFRLQGDLERAKQEVAAVTSDHQALLRHTHGVRRAAIEAIKRLPY